MARHKVEIPAERERQFDLIAAASAATLDWARAHAQPLLHIEPVVPFVETDFSLDAWLFLDSEDRIKRARADGTADVLAAQFCAELAKAGYPREWLSKVSCHFGSKEVVDRDFQGSYYYFLR
jgi:hypothetical protein